MSRRIHADVAPAFGGGFRGYAGGPGFSVSTAVCDSEGAAWRCLENAVIGSAVGELVAIQSSPDLPGRRVYIIGG